MTMVIKPYKLSSETVSASQFKAKCLGLMDSVAEHGGSLTVTKNGKPVVQVVPYRSKPKSLLGLHKGKIKIRTEIVSSIGSLNDAEDWEINR